MKRNLHFFILLSFLFWVGCKDQDPPQVLPEVAGVVIVNEGNFLSGDGSIDLFDLETETRQADVFQTKNGFALGANIQNALVHEDLLLLVCNATDKLEVLDATTFQSLGVVEEGLATPFDVAVAGKYAFVTNWGTFNSETFAYDDPKIVTINLTDYSIVATLRVEIQPQHILVVENQIFVTNVGGWSSPGTTVSVFSHQNGALSKTADITVPAGPDRLVTDKNGKIWVLSTRGHLVRIDPVSREVEFTLSDVPVLGFNEKMTIDPSGDRLFWLASHDEANAVFTMRVAESQVGAALVSGSNFYGIGVDENETLYIGEHAAFQGNGSVLRYDVGGATPQSLETLAAGRAPNGFLFLK